MQPQSGAKTTKQRPLRVGLISLGCAKNLVDAEIMLGSLLKDGIQITNDAAQADALIVNTCSFIDSAQEESVDAILESAEVRNAKNRGQSLIVSGCLPQRFREELPKLLPEVDAFMGIDQVAQVSEIVKGAIKKRGERIGKNPSKKGEAKRKASKAKIVERFAELDKDKQGEHTHEPLLEVHQRPTFIPDFATPRFRLTPKHFAYVKIAEGCNHPCSFCIIPRMRGSHRSRVQNDIVAEAKALIAEGVKEINLISQDSTYYGLDLRPNHSRAISSPEKFSAAAQSLSAGATTICTLLRELNSLEGDFWIRLLYTHPAHWTDELIRTIAECLKVARYVDMPLQHIHDNMLERMRRETSQQYISDLIGKIRAGVPGIALRTTFIVGFPGETESSFETLLDFIRETKFERLGVFTYSKEDGTRAGSMAGQISDTIKQKRRERAMAAQHKVAVAVSENFVGRTIKVLVEGEADAKQLQAASVSSWEHGLIRETDEHTRRMKGHYFIGRGEADAPDIDGRVFIRGKVPVGEFAQVKIIGHTDYDLIAQPVCLISSFSTFPDLPPKIREMIHPTAVIHPKAKLDSTVRVAPFVVIDEGVELGANCVVGPHVYLTGLAKIGSGNTFHAGSVIGDAPQDLKYKGEPTGLRIGDNNVFHEHVTIHRSSKVGEDTIVGSRNFLMQHSHVGHNAVVGNDTIIASGALLAGHAAVHDRAFISGNCLVHQFCRVGTLAMMQGGSAISKDLPPFCVASRTNDMCGLNMVGLRRAGFSPEQRLELKSVYRLLFRSGKNLREALEEAKMNFPGAVAKVLVDFVAGGKRGMCADVGRASNDAEEE